MSKRGPEGRRGALPELIKIKSGFSLVTSGSIYFSVPDSFTFAQRKADVAASLCCLSRTPGLNGETVKDRIESSSENLIREKVQCQRRSKCKVKGW